MGWLEKIFGGSTHRISSGQYHGGYDGGQYHGGYDGGQYHLGHEGGQYQGGYEDSTIWEGPTASVDALSDFDNEEIDRAIALSLAEEDQKGKKVIESEPNLEEDEALAKALQESLNVESSPPRYDFGSFFPPVSHSYPHGYRVCAGCNAEIGHGRYLSCMGAVWHPECFRCHGCNQPISDYEFSMSDNRPYHKSCYKEQHHPKCDVCKNFAHTAVFPHSYHGRHWIDNCLGTGGSIRVYLEKMVETDHVQEFIRDNPFVGGQEAITENSREKGGLSQVMREIIEKANVEILEAESC